MTLYYYYLFIIIIQKCISCGTSGVLLWQGNRYRCHTTLEKQNEHNSFCASCAEGVDEDGDATQCPEHLENAWPESEHTPLEKVFE